MPTLYIGKAGNSHPMQAVQFKEDYLTYFRENFVVPHEEAAVPGETHNLENYDHTTTTITDKDFKKRYRLPAAIAGDMKPNSGHSDANTLGRDLLPLDFDDIADEGQFLYQIYHDLARSGIGFIIYKTFSYRPDNVRYRVLIPLSRMITDKNEFRALMMALAAMLHTELDPAATRWGQVFIMPVITENNATNFMAVHEGYPLVVDRFLERILKEQQLAPAKQALLVQPKAAYQAPVLKTVLAFEWDGIVAGTWGGGYSETHLFMTRIGMSNGEIEAWLKYFDTLVPHPQPRKKQVGGDDYIRNPQKRKKWATMFNSLINGTKESDTSTGNARNGTMFQFVAFLIDQKVLAETLNKLVCDMNARNVPPLSEHELNGIINSALYRKKVE